MGSSSAAQGSLGPDFAPLCGNGKQGYQINEDAAGDEESAKSQEYKESDWTIPAEGPTLDEQSDNDEDAGDA